MNEFKIFLTAEQELRIRSQVRVIIESELEKMKSPTVQPQRYMNKKQTCNYLNISNNTLSEWIKQGLPIIRINGTLRFDKKAIDKWLSNLAQPH